MTYRTDVLAETGLVALWGLDETTGTTAANAVAGGAYPGTYTGTYTLGVAGAVTHSGSAALSLAGAGTVQIAHNAALQPGALFTVEFWLKTVYTGLGTPYYKWSPSPSYNGFGIQLNVAGYPGKVGIYLGSAGGFVLGATTVTDGQWHHIVVTRSGTTALNLYIDGVLDTAFTATMTTLTYSGALELGRDGFRGTLDEVAYYNVALSLAQVQAHYAAGPPPTPTPAQTTYRTAILAETDLVAYWELAETSGTTAADSAPTSPRDGTYGGTFVLGSAGAFGAGSRGLLLNGAGYVTIAHASDLQQAADWTIECWLKTTQTGLITLYHKWQTGSPYGGYGLQVNQVANKLSAYLGNGWTPGTTTSVNDGNWHHLVATRTGNVMKLYVDGALEVTETRTFAISNSQAVTLGRDAAGGSYLTGTLDEVAFYSAALSLAQVQAHYAARIQAAGGSGIRSSVVVVA